MTQHINPQTFAKALALATNLHADQLRKQTQTPYISHLMAVSSLAIEAADKAAMYDQMEAIAIGALLHDAVEDCGDKITLEDIQAEFGEQVATIVQECTDFVMTKPGQKKPDWETRKKAYIAAVAHKSKAGQLVAIADKLHNVRAILSDRFAIGEKVWDRFTATKEQSLWYYKTLAQEFAKNWPQNPLLADYKAAVKLLASG